MTTNGQELRDEIAKIRDGQERWRCPLPLREQVIAFARHRQHEGDSIPKIAGILEMSESGLRRWLEQDKPGGFRPVRVSERGSKPEGLVLVTPGGYRLEGLSTASAADVIRRLGC